MQSNIFGTPIDWQLCDAQKRRQLLTRPAISASESISESVREILNRVRNEGDSALRELSTTSAIKIAHIRMQRYRTA